MVYCPHCGVELINPFLDDRVSGIPPCNNGCVIEGEKEMINEFLYCEALDELDERTGYNLYRAYRMPVDTDIRYLGTSGGGELPMDELRRLIRSMVEYLIIGDVKSADGVLGRIPRSEHRLRSKIERLRELDGEAFYDNSEPFPPWDSVISMSDVADEGSVSEDGSMCRVNNKWFGTEDSDENFEELMVEKTHYRGSDITVIGEYHSSYEMIDEVKSEIKGCQLVLVEAGPGNEFTPEYAVGSHAADEYRDLVGVDVVRVLEGRSDAVPPDLSHIDSMDARERWRDLQDARSEDSESFDEFISSRDMKFAVDAVRHIEEYAQSHSYPAQVAILVGKNHVPGVSQYFGGLD